MGGWATCGGGDLPHPAGTAAVSALSLYHTVIEELAATSLSHLSSRAKMGPFHSLLLLRSRHAWPRPLPQRHLRQIAGTQGTGLARAGGPAGLSEDESSSGEIFVSIAHSRSIFGPRIVEPLRISRARPDQTRSPVNYRLLLYSRQTTSRSAPL